MPKKNYSKEIAEFQKRIDELKLEEANEKLAPVIKASKGTESVDRRT